MPGPEIQAAAAWTALEGFPLRDAPGWADVLAIVAVGLAAPLVALRFKIVPATLAGLAVLAGFLVIAQLGPWLISFLV
jgi:hypothetical protein